MEGGEEATTKRSRRGGAQEWIPREAWIGEGKKRASPRKEESYGGELMAMAMAEGRKNTDRKRRR